MPKLSKIVPCLWFDGKAEEAARYYVSIFPHSRITGITRYGTEGKEIHGHDAGTVLTVAFELQGQPFTALNGGPQFRFSEAVSLQVMCESQDEIDRYWEKLSAGGDPKAQQCGWLKDRFGLSWQVAPEILQVLIADQDPKRANRVMHAMMAMKKLDLRALESAWAG